METHVRVITTFVVDTPETEAADQIKELERQFQELAEGMATKVRVRSARLTPRPHQEFVRASDYRSPEGEG